MIVFKTDRMIFNTGIPLDEMLNELSKYVQTIYVTPISTKDGELVVVEHPTLKNVHLGKYTMEELEEIFGTRIIRLNELRKKFDLIVNIDFLDIIDPSKYEFITSHDMNKLIKFKNKVIYLSFVPTPEVMTTIDLGFEPKMYIIDLFDPFILKRNVILMSIIKHRNIVFNVENNRPLFDELVNLDYNVMTNDVFKVLLTMKNRG